MSCICLCAIFVLSSAWDPILPGIENFRHFASRLAVLLNSLTPFWLVACPYLPSSRPSCLKLLNCCCRSTAAIYCGDSSRSWAWVATKAGQLSMLFAAKRVEGEKLAVFGTTTKTLPRCTALSATSDGPMVHWKGACSKEPSSKISSRSKARWSNRWPTSLWMRAARLVLLVS